MTKIVVRIPEPKEEYDFSNQKQSIRSRCGTIGGGVPQIPRARDRGEEASVLRLRSDEDRS